VLSVVNNSTVTASSGVAGTNGTNGTNGGNVEVGNLHGNAMLMSTGEYANGAKTLVRPTIDRVEATEATDKRGDGRYLSKMSKATQDGTPFSECEFD